YVGLPQEPPTATAARHWGLDRFLGVMPHAGTQIVRPRPQVRAALWPSRSRFTVRLLLPHALGLRRSPTRLMRDSKDKPGEGAGELQVPKAVVSRLSLYLRELQHLVRDGYDTTSSTQLGKLLGFTDAQVRKDLAYFGQFGYPGIGYRCSELIDAI